MRVFSNFGGNVTLRPQRAYEPANAEEVLTILKRHRGRSIRTIGRLHSWSQSTQADEVLIDLRNLNDVILSRDEIGPIARIGGGCQIKRILHELDRHELTLPAVGLITEQTIAGATATGTHGSGKHCLSHYLTAVWIAGYDNETGEPLIREVRGGEALRAAQCSLGCLGVVVAVELRPRPQYHVEEWLEWEESLDQVLAWEATTPIQQFHLIPWRWQFFVQRRREVASPRSRIATLYRFQWLVGMDVLAHIVMCTIVRFLRSPWLIKLFYGKIIRWVLVSYWPIVEKSHRALTMEHELFRHIEIELFVRRSQLGPALQIVRQVLTAIDGDVSALNATSRARLARLQLLEPLVAAAGKYTHHYPICVRRVLPDDTLISMANGGTEDFYAISLISYEKPHERAAFQTLARTLAHALADEFDARCHWGKVCPLSPAEVERMYPRLARFQAICREWDRDGIFQNDWTRKLLRQDTDFEGPVEVNHVSSPREFAY